MDLSQKRIYIAGSSGMVGSAVTRALGNKGCNDLLLRHSSELDLRRQASVEKFFADEKPEVVVLAAAKVGGILANSTYRADFIYENLVIEANVIEAARQSGVNKLIFLGSSMVYPADCPQPIKEESLLTGGFEPVNEPYAIAKAAGLKLCENYYRQYGCNFYTAIPTNLYGENDNFDLTSSHVIPALIRKFHNAKTGGATTVEVWGTGSPKREFLYADDLADAIVFLLENVEVRDLVNAGVYHINVGSGIEASIKELAEMVAGTVGFTGSIEFDTTKPDGAPRKLLDHSRINKFGWSSKTDLEAGLRAAYEWYLGARVSEAGVRG
jgi:GDP-L-fucose synthase